MRMLLSVDGFILPELPWLYTNLTWFALISIFSLAFGALFVGIYWFEGKRLWLKILLTIALVPITTVLVMLVNGSLMESATGDWAEKTVEASSYQLSYDEVVQADLIRISNRGDSEKVLLTDGSDDVRYIQIEGRKAEIKTAESDESSDVSLRSELYLKFQELSDEDKVLLSRQQKAYVIKHNLE